MQVGAAVIVGVGLGALYPMQELKGVHVGGRGWVRLRRRRDGWELHPEPNNQNGKTDRENPDKGVLKPEI